jgi:tRNA(Ile)-lysidine synthase
MSDCSDPFLFEMDRFIRARGLLPSPGPVIVGVSGGADSVALAAALAALDYGPLTLAHVHHGLRGPAADADAALVEDLAGQLSAAAEVVRIDAGALAAEAGVGLEEAGRKARYDAFAELAGRAGAGAVAVAHHLDDQAETVVHRIFRGTHRRGLAGMPAARTLTDGVRLVRPLLWARREQIEHFCRRRGLTWRDDASNAATDFTRNFIRHRIMPQARSGVNPRCDEAIARLAAAAAEAQAALEGLAEELFERAAGRRGPGRIVLRAAPLRKAQPLLARMALLRALEHVGAGRQEITRERMDELLAVAAGRLPAVDLPGGVRAEAEGAAVVIRNQP